MDLLTKKYGEPDESIELPKFYQIPSDAFIPLSVWDVGPRVIAVVLIKTQLLAVDKHPFFSYYAIPNTLIGEAANSSDVKPIWLSHPNKFRIESTDKDHKKPGYISIRYSKDGGLSWIALEKKADFQNIDDVALFKYELFTAMGVLEEFISKGDKAISYMNSHQYLAHR